ncbi:MULTISPECIES: CDP-glucose 4,6-dehydratase [Aphanothece]|uniref:CDP-glucose 4,6-dehydratase n=1 Tax=Aphanothece TaxID=1121 RepID=UPI003985467E
MTWDPAFWNGRSVLITGHTGFKGAWLALWLLQLGAQVHGLALAAEGERNLYADLALETAYPGQFIARIVDLRDPLAAASAVQDAAPSVVIHLAAQALVRRSYADPIGTWSTNLMGSLHLLEALKPLQQHCAVVMVTTDKVYANQEWIHGYRELDPLGGHDPYSASKAGAEIAIASWRDSFCGQAPHQVSHLAIATARAGNVIGGGDWAEDRIVPDAIRACAKGEPIALRRPQATRPWQHVLEPLGAYLLLAEALSRDPLAHAEAWNFGPALESSRSVHQLIETLHGHWHGSWFDASDPADPHEAGLLHLAIDKAWHQLAWRPRWCFETAVARTARWYRQVEEGASPLACCQSDLAAYLEA